MPPRESNKWLMENMASMGGGELVQDQANAEEELSTKDERDKQIRESAGASTEIVETKFETDLPLAPSVKCH